MKYFVREACNTSEAGMVNFETKLFQRVEEKDKKKKKKKGPKLKGDAYHIYLSGLRIFMSDGRYARRDLDSLMEWLFISKMLHVVMKKTASGDWPLTKMQALDRYLGLLQIYKITSSKNCYYSAYKKKVDQFALCFTLMLVRFGHPSFAALAALEYNRFLKAGAVNFEWPSVTWESGVFGVEFCIRNLAGGIVEFLLFFSPSFFPLRVSYDGKKNNAVSSNRKSRENDEKTEEQKEEEESKRRIHGPRLRGTRPHDVL